MAARNPPSVIRRPSSVTPEHLPCRISLLKSCGRPRENYLSTPSNSQPLQVWRTSPGSSRTGRLHLASVQPGLTGAPKVGPSLDFPYADPDLDFSLPEASASAPDPGQPFPPGSARRRPSILLNLREPNPLQAQPPPSLGIHNAWLTKLGRLSLPRSLEAQYQTNKQTKYQRQKREGRHP